jgi:SAM-dependent methyltransferase
MANSIKKEIWNFISIPRIGYDEKDYFNHHLGKYGLVASTIKDFSPHKILDIGIASGIFYSLLPDFYTSKVFGIDVVPEYMPILKKRGIEARLCNIEKEPIPCSNESFDLVICDSILEHTLKPKDLITEIDRVLVPGGHFIIVVPNATSIIKRWQHLRGYNIFEPLIDNLYFRDYLSRCAVFYSKRDLRIILEEISLVIDKISYLNETSYDEKKLFRKIARILGVIIPEFRDVIFLTGHKNL